MKCDPMKQIVIKVTNKLLFRNTQDFTFYVIYNGRDLQCNEITAISYDYGK